ncbi:MAG TPA: hypothetical protein VNO55_05685 [Polyangia bacterium]|nr:hypothetical protein [Polyangia bacterium]
MSLSLGIALLLAAVPVSVEGNAGCPSVASVVARLSAVLPDVARGGGEPVDRARVELAAERITVTLRGPDGTLIGERTLVAQGSCEERARAVAVVLGTWESDVHPAFRLPVSSAVGAPPSPAPAPEAPRPVVESPVEKPPASVVTQIAPGPAASASRATWDLGVGVLGILADSQLTASVRVVATATPLGHWGGRLALEGAGERGVAAGSGEGRWSRWSASLGPQHRVTLASWGLQGEGHLSAQGAMFQVQGQGYPVSYQVRGFDVGGAAGLRLLAPGTRWRPWLAVDGTRWLGRRTVRELVSGQEREIPSWMASAALGFSFFSP